MKLYKVLNEDMSCIHGQGSWSMDWMPEIEGDLIPCTNGYHLCREQDLVHWLGPSIYRVEHEGELLECANKVVVRKARIIEKIDAWNDRSARLFACNCADHVLPLYEKEYPDDTCIRSCIEVARRFANGKATVQELAAAWSAVETATVTAAVTATVTAAVTATVTDQAAERKWQTERLFEILEAE